MEIMNKAVAKFFSKIVSLREDESGSQTLEWIGIAAVIVILVGVISTAMSGATGIGQDVVNKIQELIAQIG